MTTVVHAMVSVRSSEVGDLVPASQNALETVSTIAEEEATPNRLVGSIKEDPKKKAATTPRTAPRLTAGELDKAVTISLVETETFWLLDIGECDTHQFDHRTTHCIPISCDKLN
jgi:hypothetical protein